MPSCSRGGLVSAYNNGFVVTKPQGATMAGLSNALQELRAERTKAQSQVEKLDQAISMIESLNGRTSHKATRPVRVISAASRRKMAKAQKERWARARNGTQPAKETKTVASAPAKRVMSSAARKKIAAFQRARWAKLKRGKKAA